MNTVLWIAQVILALAFAGSGFAKLAMPLKSLGKRMSFVNHLPPMNVRLIGLVEVLGAIGVIVPWLTKILPILTPLAAVGLAITMIGAIVTHIGLNELPKSVPPVVLLVLAVFVAYGQFVLRPTP